MNKIIKAILYILICGIMCSCGFLICKYQVFTKHIYLLSQTKQEDNNSILLESNIQDSTDFQSQENKGDVFTLTETELAFLEEHLYGQWRFSERLFALDDSENTYHDVSSNISDEGVKELKKAVVLSYEKDIIWFPVEIGQSSFSNPKDMFLFGKRGGFQWIQSPVYNIEKLDTDIINLEDIYNPKGYDVQFEDAINFIKVTYYTQREKGEYNQRKVGRNFADIIYIDFNNKDTIYIDFCGLWKMERDENDYSTGGKSDR